MVFVTTLALRLRCFVTRQTQRLSHGVSIVAEACVVGSVTSLRCGFGSSLGESRSLLGRRSHSGHGVAESLGSLGLLRDVVTPGVRGVGVGALGDDLVLQIRRNSAVEIFEETEYVKQYSRRRTLSNGRRQ